MTHLMRLIENGRVDPLPITHGMPFAQIERAFDKMETKADGIIKPLIIFG